MRIGIFGEKDFQNFHSLSNHQPKYSQTFSYYCIDTYINTFHTYVYIFLPSRLPGDVSQWKFVCSLIQVRHYRHHPFLHAIDFHLYVLYVCDVCLDILRDKAIRIFDFAKGKLMRKYDESAQVYSANNKDAAVRLGRHDIVQKHMLSYIQTCTYIYF